MNTSQIFWLLLVSAIWGASHSLIKFAVPEWGSSLTTFLRVMIAAVVLTSYSLGAKKQLNFKDNFRHFFIVAVFNAAFPIFLFAYAARSLPASYLVILNATAPIFNAMFSSVWLNDPFTMRKVGGILLGMGGIYLLEDQGTLPLTPEAWVGMGCALGASACYGFTAVFLKRSSKKVDSTVLTAGSSALGAVLLFPFAFQQGDWHWSWGPALPSILILGLLGSGFAFVIYYRLLEQIGPFRASLTTFLMPIFGLFWGWLFLNERVNGAMLLGVGLIISATSLFLTLKKTPKTDK